MYFVDQKKRLKPTAKRTNRTMFFDDETDLYPLAMAPNEGEHEPVQGNALFRVRGASGSQGTMFIL